nr:hypothetical protein [Candidatus Njordarchaeum guaymaensis]
MASPKGERARGEHDETEPVKGESDDSYASLQSSLTDVKEGLERLTKSVGDLNSKLQSTGEVLKWVLNALSQRSEEKETLYLKNIQASTELLKSFVDFLESKLGSFGEVPPKPREAKPARKETPTKEVHPAPSKEEGEFMVKPSLVRRLQEEQGKDKDKKSR